MAFFMSYLFFIFSIVGMLAGCGAPGSRPAVPEITAAVPDVAAAAAKKAEYRKITAKEAHEMMAEQSGYIILDVRTDSEYKEKRLDGAILIPDYEIKKRVESELADKDVLIFVYCRSGRRSEGAAREMANLGYTNVYDFGGINDWPYDTVSG